MKIRKKESQKSTHDTKKIDIKDKINKIIYIDQESIENSLLITSGGLVKEEYKVNAEVYGEIAGELNLNFSFLNRIKFMFSSKFRANYLNSYNKTRIKKNINYFIDNIDEKKYKFFKNIEITDITNSFSSIKALTPFVKILNSDEEYDFKVFNEVFNEVEGYETYKIKNKKDNIEKKEIYLRFNSKAFISNYKRMEILNSELTCVAVYVGQMDRTKFDFNYIMGNLSSNVNDYNDYNDLINKKIGTGDETKDDSSNNVDVYDVIISYIPNLLEGEK